MDKLEHKNNSKSIKKVFVTDSTLHVLVSWSRFISWVCEGTQGVNSSSLSHTAVHYHTKIFTIFIKAAQDVPAISASSSQCPCQVSFRWTTLCFSWRFQFNLCQVMLSPDFLIVWAKNQFNKLSAGWWVPVWFLLHLMTRSKPEGVLQGKVTILQQLQDVCIKRPSAAHQHPHSTPVLSKLLCQQCPVDPPMHNVFRIPVPWGGCQWLLATQAVDIEVRQLYKGQQP